MPAAASTVQERRQSIRRDGSPPQMAINLLRSRGAVPAGSVNFSEHGLCLRLEETLEVRSLVRLQMTPTKSARLRLGTRPLECTGRVTWVVQRLDLRHGPPFLFDVGIEFVDPPAPLRRVLLQQGMGISAADSEKLRAPKKWLAPSAVRGREYVPKLERSIQSGQRWRLVVSVEGVPCFSGHYPSERAAAIGWERFKRQQAKR